MLALAVVASVVAELAGASTLLDKAHASSTPLEVLSSSVTAHWVASATPFTRAQVSRGHASGGRNHTKITTDKDGKIKIFAFEGVVPPEWSQYDGFNSLSFFQESLVANSKATTPGRINADGYTGPETFDVRRLSPDGGKHSILDSRFNGSGLISVPKTLVRSARKGRVAITTFYKVALIKVRFNQELRLTSEGQKRETCALHRGGSVAKQPDHLNCSEPSFCATRMVCGVTLFESHPSRVSGNIPPLYIMPWEDPAVPSVVRLFLSQDQDLKDPAVYSAVMLLEHSTARKSKRLTTVNLKEEHLQGCSLQFLEPQSQNCRRPQWIVSTDGVPFFERVPLQVVSSVKKPQHRPHPRKQRNSRASCPAGSVVSNKREWGMVRQSILQDTKAVLSTADLNTPLSVLLETEANIDSQLSTGAKFMGLLSGVIGPLVKPLGDLMGDISGDIIATMTAKPVTIATTPGLSEGITSGVTPPLANFLISNVAPSVTETATDAIIETLSNFMSDYITENMTPDVAKRLTESVGHDLLPRVVGEISTVGVMKMARMVSESLVHILSRSIPHSVVGALTHSLTHSPLTDYYCYYCFKYEVYCTYCTSSWTPSQFYYSMYYTGWYSTYYSMYYESDKDLHVKMVRKKAINFEDPGDFAAPE